MVWLRFCMSNYFLLSYSCPTQYILILVSCTDIVGGGGGGGSNTFLVIIPTGDRLDPATGYCSPARGIFLAGATAESGGQVPPVTGDSGWCTTLLSVETIKGDTICLAAQFFRAESPVGAVCDLATITDCPHCHWWGCDGATETSGWSASARHDRS